MGRFPVEILLQVIQGAVETIPIPDLARMRLVNSTRPVPFQYTSRNALTIETGLFAHEIMTLLLQSPRLEDDGFGFADESRHAGRKPYKIWWTQFPMHYKRQYLHKKVQQHPINQCKFTTAIHECLAIPHAPRTKEEEHILIDRLIDAWLCGRYVPFRRVYDHRCFHRPPTPWESDWYARPLESAELTMSIALAVSAIIKGDCEEIQKLIDTHDDPEYGPLAFLWDRSERFGGIYPVEIAGLKGSTEVIRLLIANDHNSQFVNRSGRAGIFELASKMGHMSAVKGWIEHFKNTNEDLATRLNSAVMTAVRIRRRDIVEFIEKESGIQFDKSEVMFDMFMEGIVRTRMSQVQYYLNWGGFDINMETTRFRYGPVNGAIYGARGPLDLKLVAFLLEKGADPNKFNPTAKLTPLQIAVQTKNVALARLLIERGADVGASLLFQKKKSRIPLLQVAVEGRSVPMVRLLLENGLDRKYVYKGRKVEVKGDTVEGDDSQICIRREVQEDSRSIDDQNGYVVLLGDKVDKRRPVVEKQALGKMMSTGVLKVFIK
ncbi:uncharacterized protein N7496_003986 [Penicillium cataractarum]|uniref:Ankyrin n=1 Tax=Penicillium cataractarum TaxID=2100454 RepID=A0A9W9SN45_9EURO|nr:uncharacterized protein N7496_003986 [Penicillium cataractarum]KAJ5381558.1 hypothetical protein N7496_003986 [Penicillium cataractarum]